MQVTGLDNKEQKAGAEKLMKANWHETPFRIPGLLCRESMGQGHILQSLGVFHLRLTSSPKYSLEICVLQKSYFL